MPGSSPENAHSPASQAESVADTAGNSPSLTNLCTVAVETNTQVSQAQGCAAAVSSSMLLQAVPVNDDLGSAALPSPASLLWDVSSQSTVPEKAKVPPMSVPKDRSPKKSVLVQSEKPCQPLLSELPFMNADDMSDSDPPARPLLKPSFLKESVFALSKDKLFVDRMLPPPSINLEKHCNFHVRYYVDLYRKTSAPGSRGQYSWPANTPNYIGARVPLIHTSFKLDVWRKHLIGYKSPELVQFLEFGFPLGLEENPSLSPSLRNHGSSYQYFPWLDKFFADGLVRGGVTGPCGAVPFDLVMVSPLMTAPKKPSSRRAVFDATYGAQSLNHSTPLEYYLGERISYTYPKIEDFQRLVLKCGQGCFLFKRDLSRYYLQLPLDPTEYRFTGVVWRLLFFFFVSLMFGLRHSGYQGQKVSDAVSWIHRNLGLEYFPPEKQAREPTSDSS